MRNPFKVEPELHKDMPRVQPLELGKWHAKRGRFDDALSCLEKAVLETSQSSSQEGDPDRSAESWIEYGRINTKLNKYAEADEAFRHALSIGPAYAVPSLKGWASLLHRSGYSDYDIYHRLASEAASYDIPVTYLGIALHEIGAYKEGELCFHMDHYNDIQTGKLHISCLMANNRLNEAITLIGQLKHKFALHNWSWDENQSFISVAHFLCKWRLEGKLPFLPTCIDDRLKIAESAISLGMIAEAELILADEGIIGEYALINFLYAEGYFCEVEEKLKKLEDGLIDVSVLYGTRLQFIMAERLYDQGQYEQASELFENIRLMHPECTAARFGEAACYLQCALLSLTSRLEKIDTPDSVKEQALEYMNSIHAALHIVESTEWHTSWTPAQLRHKVGYNHTILLN